MRRTDEVRRADEMCRADSSLMMVSGHHWIEDVAGENDDSWKNALIRAGYEVTCVRTGLLERREVREILIGGV